MQGRLRGSEREVDEDHEAHVPLGMLLPRVSPAWVDVVEAIYGPPPIQLTRMAESSCSPRPTCPCWETKRES